ncbi:MAG: Holliday junction resolvase-like protein [Candidatus Diapherotrites archaeon]
MLEIFLALIALLLAFFLFLFYRKTQALQAELDELASKKQSMSTRYGQLTEQWLPLMDSFPYDPKNFRFLGSPIDGIAFNEDKIVFCEFKFSSSTLTPKEKNIKRLVEEGKVEWKEFSVK